MAQPYSAAAVAHACGALPARAIPYHRACLRRAQWFCPHNPFTLLLGGDANGPERPRAAAQWRKPIKTH